jgi:hypothetical protein
MRDFDDGLKIICLLSTNHDFNRTQPVLVYGLHW